MNVSRKCVENILYPPDVVRTRGTWHVCVCLHIPPITGVSVAADTGKYYSWRDYLESVLSILRWTLATTLCDAPHTELWLPGNTHRIQHKKYFNIKKYLIANVVASCGRDDGAGLRMWCSGPARGAPELPAPPPPLPASNPGITARPLPSRHYWAMNCVRQVLLHQCVFFMHIISNTNTSTCVACLLVSGIVQYLVLQAWR